MEQPTRRSFRDLVWNIFATYGASWLWVSYLVLALSASIGATHARMPVVSVTFHLLSFFPPVAAFLQASPGTAVFMGLVFAPVFEEMVFRMLPLTLVRGKSPETIRAVQLAVCGVLFGIAHGSPINVFIQGFVGYMLGRLYMKNHNSQFTAYVSCVLVHAAYNFTVLAAGAMH
ncbi:MAG TPA: CPBP family intramembrane glutamic endopeptidase [Candidatus Binatia bacterium]|nr:CPBP family intramembrane glutamic endopeptidase [Candidatus Binatia bacterium]